MLHETRVHDISRYTDALEACREALRITWCLCQGYLIDDAELPRPVLLLNDSITTDYDRYCEYALFVRDGETWTQTESVTMNGGAGLSPERLLDIVRCEAECGPVALDSTCNPPNLDAHGPGPCCHCA